jgi:ribosomal protein S12 methylthiotransferase accessory factor
LKKRIRLEQTKQRLNDLLDNKLLVNELSDHDLLYSHPSMLKAFDFMRRNKLEELEWTDNTNLPDYTLPILIEKLKSIGSDLIYYNLSAPELAAIGIYATRVILPEFQPIHFGANRIRLSGKRMFDLPIRLGLQDTLSASNFNYDPHPLA